jgi:hypothetical protein
VPIADGLPQRIAAILRFELVARFGLRQLPGTLDLIGLDNGVRALATFRTEGTVAGTTLFRRCGLVACYSAKSVREL